MIGKAAAPESRAVVTVDGSILLAGTCKNLFQQPARSAEGVERVALAFVV